jgi:hypothetical protein
MIGKLGAAIFIAFIATPALAQSPGHYADPSSGSSSSSAGGGCVDSGCMAPRDPVDVPAPPVVLLFAAAAMAVIARRRSGSAPDE